MVKMLKPKLQSVPSRLKTAPASTSWRGGKTTNERGYTYRWQQERQHFLRAHPLCRYCEREGRLAAASVVDHMKPHRGDMGLFWDQSNWQPLCKPCHDSAKALEERRAQGG